VKLVPGAKIIGIIMRKVKKHYLGIEDCKRLVSGKIVGNLLIPFNAKMMCAVLDVKSYKMKTGFKIC
jgi:hypothetical protein